MCNEDNNYGGITPDAFMCIQNFFLLINENDGFLSKTVVPKYSSFTSFSNVTGASYTPYSFTQRRQEDVKNQIIKTLSNAI
jgi:hypothetical protein